LIDLPSGVDMRARLADAFEIRPAGAVSPDGLDAVEAAMRREHGLGLVDGHGLALAIPRAEARAATEAAEPGVVAGTDTALVRIVVVRASRCHVAIPPRRTARCRPCRQTSRQHFCARRCRSRRPRRRGCGRTYAETTFFSPKPHRMVFRTLG
jgi:hypothetical protein